MEPNSTLFVTAFESRRAFRKHKRAGLSGPSRTVEINWTCSRQSFLRASKEGLLVIKEFLRSIRTSRLRVTNLVSMSASAISRQLMPDGLHSTRHFDWP